MPTTDPVPSADALGARRIMIAVDEIVACLRTHEAELVGGRGPGGIVIGSPGNWPD